MSQRLLLEGSDIDELLARVRVEHGPDARIVHAEQKLVGGVAGFFARRRFEVAVAVDDETPAASRPVQRAAAPASIEDLLALADAGDGAAPVSTSVTAPATTEPVASSATQRAAGRQVSTDNPSFDHFVRDLISRAEGGPLHLGAGHDAAVDSEPARAEVAFVPAVPRVEAEVEAQPTTRPVAEPTTRPVAEPVAVPVVEPAAGTDPRLVLLDTLTAVAVAPPRRLAGTQVVVGPKVRARIVAKAWVTECGEDSAALVETADVEDVLGGPPPSRGRVVVVDAGSTVADARRVGRRLAEVGPDAVTAVTAVVDARWDVTTSRAWLAALAENGVRVDHVAAHSVDDAAQPLRLLDLGVPVTWLDARPATLGAWAGPCLDRL